MKIKLVLSFTILLFSQMVFSKCIEKPSAEISKLTDSKAKEEILSEEYRLIHSEDSCGGRGCEYFLFKKKDNKCFELVFNKIGFYLKFKTKNNSLLFKSDKRPRLYHYNPLKRIFE